MREVTAFREAQDKSYFLRRAAQERSAAADASGEQAREAHAELAKRYRRLASKAPEQASEAVR